MQRGAPARRSARAPSLSRAEKWHPIERGQTHRKHFQSDGLHPSSDGPAMATSSDALVPSSFLFLIASCCTSKALVRHLRKVLDTFRTLVADSHTPHEVLVLSEHRHLLRILPEHVWSVWEAPPCEISTHKDATRGSWHRY